MIAGFTYIGVNMQEPNYYCLDREITAHCEGFSKYYSLENGKCLNKLVGNKLCRSGWEKIPSPVSVQFKGSGASGVYHCNSKGCE